MYLLIHIIYHTFLSPHRSVDTASSIPPVPSYVRDISAGHTGKIPGGHIGVLFYDVTTLYFEADYEDELRKTGFSKEGRHKNPQIIPGLPASLGGCPPVCRIHEGNKHEDHTMLPAVTEFVHKYS